MEELPIEETKADKELEQPTVETPKSIAAMKTQWAKFQNLTAKNASDNLWLIGMKYFLKGIMVLILILLSPIFLLVMTITILATG